jgi:pimeloyl-ACP methyl ester carboxylesterase
MSVEGAVLVHGGMCTAACWDPVVTHLAMPVVAVDLPGRGSRPADLFNVTLDDCVQAVIDSADEAGFERFTLVGHSVGGVTIIETAWRHPRRVTQLIYVGALVPAPGGSVSIIQTGAGLPPRELVTIEEAVAKAIFGNDLNDEQWTQTWQGFVPDAASIMNAQLTGYPDNVPITYVSMTDDVPVPPCAGRANDRKSRCGRGTSSAVGWPHGDDLETPRARHDHQRHGHSPYVLKHLVPHCNSLT